jgi:alkyl sulfatase BDS1-like metallo-beta-lactamase superfamily hydrolase
VWHALRARQVISAQIVRGTRTVAAAKPVEAMQGSTGQSAPQRSGAEITSLQQVFAGLPVIFNKEAARGLTAIYQFDFSGEHAAQYHVVIENETCSVKEGTHPSPHMTLSMAGEDYLDLVNGKLNPQMAFMSGKMKISGDMSLAMKMASLFPRPS